MRAAFVAGTTKVVRDLPDLRTPSGAFRSNNVAEYQALILLLQHLRELEKKGDTRKSYLICGDSELVIRQMRGEYRVTKPHLIPLHAEALRLSSDLGVEFRWVPREENPAGFLLETHPQAETKAGRQRR